MRTINGKSLKGNPSALSALVEQELRNLGPKQQSSSSTSTRRCAGGEVDVTWNLENVVKGSAA